MANVRDTIRRQATDPLLVYDMETNLPIGQIINMSYRGMKLMTEEPVVISKIYYCRIPLPEKLLGRDELFIDAECRWCRKNEETSWYDSGYCLRKPSTEDADIIKLITHKWMIEQSEKMNSSNGVSRSKRVGILSKVIDGLIG